MDDMALFSANGYEVRYVWEHEYKAYKKARKQLDEDLLHTLRSLPNVTLKFYMFLFDGDVFELSLFAPTVP